jgi:hypothetical protein
MEVLVMDKIDWIERMQVLEVKEGDTIILKTQQVLSVDQHVIITECIGDMFKERNVKVLVLDDGMDIGVIRSGNEKGELLYDDAGRVCEVINRFT